MKFAKTFILIRSDWMNQEQMSHQETAHIVNISWGRGRETPVKGTLTGSSSYCCRFAYKNFVKACGSYYHMIKRVIAINTLINITVVKVQILNFIHLVQKLCEVSNCESFATAAIISRCY